MIDNYEMIKTISLLLILFSVIIIALAIIFVHTMPGKIARSRNHPQAEAIEITSLLGLLVFPLWIAALIWAYIKQAQPVLPPQNYPGNTDKENFILAASEAQHAMQEQKLSNEKMTQADSTMNKPLGSSEDADRSNESIVESSTKR
ncbi:hypothetical protein bplSymb_SCF04001P003 [Bathymodiolus platifrons methanotrophic gill symbiont]|uniref:DUF3302 domain-containing protein n=1 Tax=Bathymodiolus platifrons methanotrophic gill symbiont TaxID=113268 RepID=UPI000B41F378|nr:DUF3302 domain-containing protein [Bathymodiolus platifrons methanotrophic gill symbiont]MCK5869050.1 DUF3302 domain-containing protein [Methyloprofundus sp.]GAW86790.1 hypothetical protein bplSymb_SCF04001P003 [Bathymodiolus platifrons methanotrophic gill symbiont]GFO73957.1 hypothetical protein BPLS_P0320 [Bathymodiolus platifrons methanotrophic gill symbiont]